MLDTCTLERRSDVGGGLADQVRTAHAVDHVERQLGVALALAASAEDDVERGIIGRHGPTRGRGVRRLRVVDEADAADLGDGLEAMRDPGKGLESLRDPRVRGSERAGGRGRSGTEIRLGDADELGATARRRPARTRGGRTGRGGMSTSACRRERSVG